MKISDHLYIHMFILKEYKFNSHGRITLFDYQPGPSILAAASEHGSKGEKGPEITYPERA